METLRGKHTPKACLPRHLLWGEPGTATTRWAKWGQGEESQTKQLVALPLDRASFPQRAAQQVVATKSTRALGLT